MRDKGVGVRWRMGGEGMSAKKDGILGDGDAGVQASSKGGCACMRELASWKGGGWVSIV